MMRMLAAFLIGTFVPMILAEEQQTAPIVHLELTEKGTEEITRYAPWMVNRYLASYTSRPVIFNVQKGQIEISDSKLESYRPPVKAILKFPNTRSVAIQGQDMDMRISGRFAAGAGPIRNVSGDYDVELLGLTVKAEIEIDLDKNTGVWSTRVSDCQASVQDLKMKLKADGMLVDKIVSSYQETLAGLAKERLPTVMCDNARKVVDNYGPALLALAKDRAEKVTHKSSAEILGYILHKILGTKSDGGAPSLPVGEAICTNINGSGLLSSRLTCKAQ